MKPSLVIHKEKNPNFGMDINSETVGAMETVWKPHRLKAGFTVIAVKCRNTGMCTRYLCVYPGYRGKLNSLKVGLCKQRQDFISQTKSNY